MATAPLSTTAWIAHDVGLATAIGGTLFGRQAFHPALRHEIVDPQQRDQLADATWRRFSWVNLAAHGVMAATWFVGRNMLSGREVSARSRSLTRVKDVLILGSLATGIASVIVGRILGKRTEQQGEPGARVSVRERTDTHRLRRTVGALGTANMLTNVGILATTAVLAMEGNKSPRFSLRSRRLP